MQHYYKLTPCAVRKDEWDTKEDTGKSMKHEFYALQNSIRRVEVTSDSERIKPIALAVIKLRLSEGISHS